MKELQYLQDSGGVSEDVMDLLSHTTGKSLESKNGLNQEPSKVPKPTFEILQPPQIMLVKESYIPRTYQGLVADCGDEVVVFAWAAHQTEAIAYNARIRRVGRLPAAILDTLDPAPFTKGNLCIAKDSKTSRPIDGIGWSAGDYIMVWDRKEGKDCFANGFGSNRATGAIGRFETSSFNLQALTQRP
jgi:hypothetical protein